MDSIEVVILTADELEQVHAVNDTGKDIFAVYRATTNTLLGNLIWHEDYEQWILACNDDCVLLPDELKDIGEYISYLGTNENGKPLS